MTKIQTHQLAAHALVRLPEQGPITVHVRRGRVWITQAGCPHDWFLEANQTLHLSGPHIVVEAEMACALDIVPTQPRWRRWPWRRQTLPSWASALPGV